MKHSIHILTAAILVASTALIFAQAPLKPTMPMQRNPFLRERGAPATAPRSAEGLMTFTGIVETFVLKEPEAVTFISSAPDGAVRYRQVQEWVGTGRARL